MLQRQLYRSSRKGSMQLLHMGGRFGCRTASKSLALHCSTANFTSLELFLAMGCSPHATLHQSRTLQRSAYCAGVAPW